MKSFFVPTLACLLAGVLVSLGGCTAPPPPNQSPDVFSVALISDLNSSYGSTEYEPAVHEGVRLITDEWRPDLVLIAGDLIAGQRVELSDSRVDSMWTAFDATVYEPIREAGIPVAFAMGNHDASRYERFARDRRMAIEHWMGRDLGVEVLDSLDFPLNYSFRAGPLFVVVWDATNEETIRDERLLDWVRRQLELPEAESARHRWIVGHLPLHAVAEGRNRKGEVLAGADTLRRMMVEYDVDVYVSGHHHAYYPGRRGPLEMLHLGALGQGPRPLIGSNREPLQAITLATLRTDTLQLDTQAFGFDDPAQRISLELDDLPERIESINGFVVRRDKPDAY
ncbi:MAG: metallophosphoesterase family protein [Bacteroidota bacterium]